MKLSELIAECQKVMDENGDIDVVVYDLRQSARRPMTSVAVEDGQAEIVYCWA